ncbi:AraC family transcriptional regulator [Alteromonas gilva]|uniref:AraC family transcriptional regulator n=1 Tax=Alteromonas gilva TaxID=2987522 RepID=A0ABT5KZ40_9ALTE|nr:AraC family transcriptional regulator [Alteromonas gilva]MDC8829476.1 AraC family transcriptional regulator [Alteromonas gilva]
MTNPNLQPNQNPITGVLHSNESAKQYNLRRYYPPAQLNHLVEQFWFVDWQLPDGHGHTQQNLPDPNFHLVIDKGVARLLGPVSKVYAYPMHGTGRILGVKFNIGALASLLTAPVTEYVDKEIPAAGCFGSNTDRLVAQLADAPDDEAMLATLHHFLRPFDSPPDPALLHTAEMLELIKHNSGISTVALLSQYSGYSVRTLQRNFQHYVGLSPKWLVRKYRLHDALASLEDRRTSIADVVALLDYSDQSHLIRDFKTMLGVTPGSYTKA